MRRWFFCFCLLLLWQVSPSGTVVMTHAQENSEETTASVPVGNQTEDRTTDTLPALEHMTQVIHTQIGSPSSQRRIALVIGNAAYGEELGELTSPLNDATDIAAILQRLGFAVTLVPNATRQRMEEALEAFSRPLPQRSVSLFYFSGHGMQVARFNYLMPIDAHIEKEADIKVQGIATEWILAKLEGAKSPLNIIILDACRNNPFTSLVLRHPSGVASLHPGLASMQAPRGTLIAYATAPGMLAAEGAGRNGIYTKHLLRYLPEPDLLIEQMLKHVRVAVEAETNGRQIPWEASSLRGDFYFNATVGLLRSRE